MKKIHDFMKSIVLFVFALCIWIIPQIACAHCDTMEGPVVMTAKAALEKGDVTLVLKWVKKDDEKEIRVFFQKTLIVMGKGKEAKDLADSISLRRWFVFIGQGKAHRTPA